MIVPVQVTGPTVLRPCCYPSDAAHAVNTQIANQSVHEPSDAQTCTHGQPSSHSSAPQAAWLATIGAQGPGVHPSHRRAKLGPGDDPLAVTGGGRTTSDLTTDQDISAPASDGYRPDQRCDLRAIQDRSVAIRQGSTLSGGKARAKDVLAA